MGANNSHRRKGASRRSVSPARRPIKVTARRKKEIDPQMVSLCYFLIASRIVREAEQDTAAAKADADDAAERSSGFGGTTESEGRL